MKFLLLFIIIAFYACNPKKNVDIYQCPVSIALQLHYIDSRILLSKESYNKLKHFLICNDSIAEVAYTNGDNLEKISSWYYPTMDTILTFLRPLEGNDMIVCAKEKYNLKNNIKSWTIRDIIYNRENLDLDYITIKRLLSVCIKLESSAINGKVSAKTEKDSIMNILPEQKLKMFFKIRNKIQARKTALAQMGKLAEKGLYIKEIDRGKLYISLFQYEMEIKGRLEYMSFIEDNKGYDQERLNMFAQKPLELLQLEALNDYSHDLLIDVLCKRDVVKPNKKQITKLLNTYQKILKAEYNAKYISHKQFNKEKHQNHYLQKILTKKQINSYFEHTCKDDAIKNAQKQWNEIKKYKIVLERDSTTLFTELINYEIKLAVVNKWISLADTREYLFLKEEIKNSRPQILTDLNTYKRLIEEKEIVKF